MRVPDVSIILVNWNTRELTDDAIASVLRFEKTVPIEIILVDNASSDDSAEWLESRHPEIRVIRNRENEGFARANNRGVAAASGAWVLLLNSDTVFKEETLPACLAVGRANSTSIVGCRLLNADGSLQISAEPFPSLRSQLLEAFSGKGAVYRGKMRPLAAASGPTPVDWLCGAFLLMDRDVYLRLGGLSEAIFMYGEDTEFCWRARNLGIQSVYLPNVSVVHLGGGGVGHPSLRSLILSDMGRVRAFTIMRGSYSGAALRAIFIARSVLRAVFWGVLGVVGRHAGWRRRAFDHFAEVLILAGVADARRFI